jgi:hypothetical protein
MNKLNMSMIFRFFPVLVLLSALMLPLHARCQKKTIVVVYMNGYAKSGNKVTLIINGVSRHGPIFGDSAVFSFDFLLKGNVHLVLINNRDTLEGSHTFSGIGMVRLEEKYIGGTEHGGGGRFLDVTEYAEIIFQSASGKLDFQIDDGSDGNSTGTTTDSRSVPPEMTHKLTWKKAGVLKCSFQTDAICQGCSRSYTCDPANGKVTQN